VVPDTGEPILQCIKISVFTTFMKTTNKISIFNRELDNQKIIKLTEIEIRIIWVHS
jgi:hypothetical protein